MRYTAVTSQPDDFMVSSRRYASVWRGPFSKLEQLLQAEQYTLRQKQLYEPTRKTEIFIVITMYNVRASVNVRGRHSDQNSRIGRRRLVRTNHAWGDGEHRPP
jgi:hypothetical protein